MTHHIVCKKKRNNPRMDVRICERKCDLKDECEEYKDHIASRQIPKAYIINKEDPIAQKVEGLLREDGFKQETNA